MPSDDVGVPTERTQLLLYAANDRRLSILQQDEEAASIVTSAVTKEEAALGGSTVGERLPYNDYTTIDWLHDLVLLLETPLEQLLMYTGERFVPMARRSFPQRPPL
jgi:hypothetical protein